MFQSSRIASGISRRHASTACWPSSASEILKSNPSRMRRATLRMTLESSTTKQLFMAPPRSNAVRGPPPRPLGFLSQAEHPVGVEHPHHLPAEAVTPAGNPPQARVPGGVHRLD